MQERVVADERDQVALVQADRNVRLRVVVQILKVGLGNALKVVLLVKVAVQPLRQIEQQEENLEWKVFGVSCTPRV